MDPDDFHALLRTSGVDLWDLIDAALSTAARDHPTEFLDRSNSIVKHIHSLATDAKPPRATNSTLEDQDDKRRKILATEMHLDDPDVHNDEVSLVAFLRNLNDMDVSLDDLMETHIGKSVNSLRKHPCDTVRSFVADLIRKWKDLVTKSLRSDNKVPEAHMNPTSPSIPQKVKKPEEDNIPDQKKLASSTKRLHENYQAAENAKKARNIKIIEIHDIPKKTNIIFPRSVRRSRCQ